MKKILTQYGVCALAVALMVPLAQSAGIQTAFGKDAGTLSDKFTGLAHVMSGKYDWKPGHAVRSVSDVFNLIVEENGLLADALMLILEDQHEHLGQSIAYARSNGRGSPLV